MFWLSFFILFIFKMNMHGRAHNSKHENWWWQIKAFYPSWGQQCINSFSVDMFSMKLGYQKVISTSAINFIRITQPYLIKTLQEIRIINIPFKQASIIYKERFRNFLQTIFGLSFCLYWFIKSIYLLFYPIL